MNFEPLEKIANAVLYEGFMLYPYRKSSVKNQQRWHFGTIDPGGLMQTECLVQGLLERGVGSAGEASVEFKIRFLQDDTEREITCAGVFSFLPVEGTVDFETTPVSDGLIRVTIRIRNTGSAAMLSAHTMLAVRQGAFVSLLDPPDEFKSAALACRNIATWPVLAGREGERGLMLSSPIILYDYPQIAPESAGDLFDGTEIDEILTLRVLTLSDDEKQEVRAGDERARNILDRTEMLPPEALAKMHGAIRGLRKASKLEFREGDRVRLRPRKRADIFDVALAGKIAIVESVERDFEDNIHLAVTVEDDPGREFGVMRQIGHRFFFGPEEVELV